MVMRQDGVFLGSQSVTTGRNISRVNMTWAAFPGEEIFDYGTGL
jgi:hypothetical protein